VGRAPPCALRIDERFVSARHAILRWTGERWDLKDLGSRNGTYLDGRKIRSGEEHARRKERRSPSASWSRSGSSSILLRPASWPFP